MARMTQTSALLLVISMAGCHWCEHLCGYHDKAGEPRLAIFRTPMGPRPGEDQHERAGYPREVSPCAHPSDTGAYVLYPVGGGEAWISSATKVAPAGAQIDIPLAYKDEVYVRSHYDAITLTLPDAPRPDEIVIIAAVATGGRVNARVGGITVDEVVAGKQS